jgi:Exo-beta-N-acetylmuramidase NamZ, C-terminal
VTDRDRLDVGRVGAALLWAVAKRHRDSLRVDTLGFDLRFGSPALRASLMRGADPDAVLDKTLPADIAFARRSRRFWLYH